MKVATLRDFRDRATAMLRSRDLVLITRDGMPAGFFVPWHEPAVPDDVRRELFIALSARVRADRRAKRVSERTILADFKTSRRSRR